MEEKTAREKCWKTLCRSSSSRTLDTRARIVECCAGKNGRDPLRQTG